MDLTSLSFGWPAAAGLAVFILFCLSVLVLKKPAANAGSHSDLRGDNRYRSKFKGWIDVNGKKCSIRGIDLNESGALIASKVHLAPDSAVFVCIESQGMMGWAKVRHCSPSGTSRYRIGLAFRGSLMRAHPGNWEFASVKRLT